jgi:hypothetical protein
MTIPDMLDSENVVAANILGCSTPKSSPNSKYISLN